MQFTDKVVLITGAGSGIGAATARRFARLGAFLVLHGRNKVNLEKVAGECVQVNANKPLVLTAELTNDSDVKALIDSIIDHYGRLDVLVNNAGILEIGTIETVSLEQYDNAMNTNMRSLYYLTMLAVPLLITSKGNIVNVSSIAGLRSFTGILPYALSKACVDQFTRCVALELAAKGVRANSVNPGVIITDIHVKGGMSEDEYEAYLEKCKTTHPLGRVGLLSEVVSTITFLASQDASNITGACIPVDGGKHALCPR
ncbi:hypothetical protein PPYR_15228 [Photinus pyralis]|uniref:Ketoreductase domain-containing protein n=1 Tax=Photinus pyralis TaxID=7054 RepID=A0A1Y1LCV1_PHOPY|nr:uncharacterized protein LOC116182165 [Photinus pyralis]KAB0790396.1 hypothetical protein PPYR_15228 [Photinus pyralis]